MNAQVIHINPTRPPLDMIREIVEAVKYAPRPPDERVVFVVEDVDGLSVGTLNALAKTMEEPPAHIAVVTPIALSALYPALRERHAR